MTRKIFLFIIKSQKPFHITVVVIFFFSYIIFKYLRFSHIILIVSTNGAWRVKRHRAAMILSIIYKEPKIYSQRYQRDSSLGTSSNGQNLILFCTILWARPYFICLSWWQIWKKRYLYFNTMKIFVILTAENSSRSFRHSNNFFYCKIEVCKKINSALTKAMQNAAEMLTYFICRLYLPSLSADFICWHG